MSEEPDRRGLSRRQTLKRGAAMGGALLWATPAVQSLTMKPAYAQVTPRVEGPSFIAMNVNCGGTLSVIKLECNGTCEFEEDPGKFPDCGDFSPVGDKADGDALGFTFTGPDPATECVTVFVPPNCTVVGSAIKDGTGCCPGPTGTGPLVFCRDTC